MIIAVGLERLITDNKNLKYGHIKMPILLYALLLTTDFKLRFKIY